MLSKTSILENRLIQEIMVGRYKVGKKFPSRNRLSGKYQCSRTTVERAVASLTRSGYLESRKGSGTFVLSNLPDRKIKRVCFVARRDLPYSDAFFNRKALGIAVDWVPSSQTEENLESLCAPGTAVIWEMPDAEQLLIMKHLKNRGIPQLLINREYHDYDRVFTDAESSIREGLSWLLIEGGRDIAAVMKTPDTALQYQYNRVIALYKLSLELGARLPADRVFAGKFQDMVHDIAEMGVRLFGRASRPKGIFVLDCSLALPLAVCARGYGLTPGKDFKLLIFDTVPELMNTPGIAMMRQPQKMFLAESRRWLESGAALEDAPFSSPCKTELMIGTN